MRNFKNIFNKYVGYVTLAILFVSFLFTVIIHSGDIQTNNNNYSNNNTVISEVGAVQMLKASEKEIKAKQDKLSSLISSCTDLYNKRDLSKFKAVSAEKWANFDAAIKAAEGKKSSSSIEELDQAYENLIKAKRDLGLGVVAEDWYDELMQITDIVDSFLVPIIVILGTAGSIYVIVLGVNFSKAESADKREESKKRMIGAIIGIVVTLLLLILAKAFTANATEIIMWVNNPK